MACTCFAYEVFSWPHSLAGVSRSVTLVTAYVMTVTGFGWEDALRTVRAGRPCANPNLGFQRQLQSFDKHEVHQVTVPGPWAGRSAWADASGVLYTPAAWSLEVERTWRTSAPACPSLPSLATSPLRSSRVLVGQPQPQDVTLYHLPEPRVGFCFFPFGSRAVSRACMSSGQDMKRLGAGWPAPALFIAQFT